MTGGDSLSTSAIVGGNVTSKNCRLSSLQQDVSSICFIAVCSLCLMLRT